MKKAFAALSAAAALLSVSGCGPLPMLPMMGGFGTFGVPTVPTVQTTPTVAPTVTAPVAPMTPYPASHPAVSGYNPYATAGYGTAGYGANRAASYSTRRSGGVDGGLSPDDGFRGEPEQPAKPTPAFSAVYKPKEKKGPGVSKEVWYPATAHLSKEEKERVKEAVAPIGEMFEEVCVAQLRIVAHNVHSYYTMAPDWRKVKPPTIDEAFEGKEVPPVCPTPGVGKWSIKPTKNGYAVTCPEHGSVVVSIKEADPKKRGMDTDKSDQDDEHYKQKTLPYLLVYQKYEKALKAGTESPWNMALPSIQNRTLPAIRKPEPKTKGKTASKGSSGKGSGDPAADAQAKFSEAQAALAKAKGKMPKGSQDQTAAAEAALKQMNALAQQGQAAPGGDASEAGPDVADALADDPEDRPTPEYFGQEAAKAIASTAKKEDNIYPVEAWTATDGAVKDSASYFTYLLSDGEDIGKIAPEDSRLVPGLAPEMLTKDGSSNLSPDNLLWRVAVVDRAAGGKVPFLVDSSVKGNLIGQAPKGSGAKMRGKLFVLPGGGVVKTEPDDNEKSVFGEGAQCIPVWP